MKRVVLALLTAALASAAVPAPEDYFGFRIGTDKKLVRWDKIVDYFEKLSAESNRVRFRNLGQTTNANPFIMLEISSAENLKNREKYLALEKKLYFQGGAPTDVERDEIFKNGKAVVFIFNNTPTT